MTRKSDETSPGLRAMLAQALQAYELTRATCRRDQEIAQAEQGRADDLLGGLGYFDLHLAEKDSNDLLGSNAAARLEQGRALFRHEEWPLGEMEKFKPYLAPEAEMLDGLLAQIHARGL